MKKCKSFGFNVSEFKYMGLKLLAYRDGILLQMLVLMCCFWHDGWHTQEIYVSKLRVYIYYQFRNTVQLSSFLLICSFTNIWENQFYENFKRIILTLLRTAITNTITTWLFPANLFYIFQHPGESPDLIGLTLQTDQHMHVLTVRYV